MIPLEQMTDEQFEQHALTILHRELGVYGLARFLRVMGSILVSGALLENSRSLHSARPCFLPPPYSNLLLPIY